MNLIDLEIVVKTLEYMEKRGQLGGYRMAVEEDGTATLYPPGKWRGKLVVRIEVDDGFMWVLACDPNDWTDCGGQAVRTRKEAWELIGQYLEMYGGGQWN